MRVITSPKQLKEYCLRKLGAPVINIEVDDAQLDDRIDDALQKFLLRHHDGANLIHKKFTWSDKDVARGFMVLPYTIVAVIDIITHSDIYTGSSGEVFDNIYYQIRDRDLLDFTQTTVTNFMLNQQHISLLNRYFSPQRRFEYNSVTHHFKPTGNFKVGDWIVISCYETLDPDDFISENIYDNEWIRRYTTALFKQQWGTNLKKWDQVSLAGGVIVKGQQIYDEAQAELDKLEEEFSLTYEEPIGMFIG